MTALLVASTHGKSEAAEVIAKALEPLDIHAAAAVGRIERVTALLAANRVTKAARFAAQVTRHDHAGSSR